MAQHPQWLNQDGTLTGDGETLIGFMEHQFEGLDPREDMAEINKLSGVFTHYMTNYYYMEAQGQKAKLPAARAKYLKDCGNSYARNAWSIYQWTLKEAADKQKLDETAEQGNEIAEALQALKEELATVKKANAKLTKKVKALETTAAEDVADAEEDEDEEPEAEVTDDEQPEADEAEEK
jgi:hypothetical protein